MTSSGSRRLHDVLRAEGGGDLAEHDRHGRLAIELARTAAGREGLALALSAWSMCTDIGSRPLETAFGLRHVLRLLADPGDPAATGTIEEHLTQL